MSFFALMHGEHACVLRPICTNGISIPVVCWFPRLVSQDTRGRTAGWGKLVQTTGRMQLVKGHVCS